MDRELDSNKPPKEFLEAKEKLRQERIKLPFSEKIKMVVEMQKLSQKLKKRGGRKVYVWELK